MSADRSITFWCAVVVGSACAFVAVSTFLPLGWVVPEGITFSLFLLIFPVFGFAVVRESRSGTPTKPADLLRRVPHPAKVALGVAGGALVVDHELVPRSVGAADHRERPPVPQQPRRPD